MNAVNLIFRVKVNFHGVFEQVIVLHPWPSPNSVNYYKAFGSNSISWSVCYSSLHLICSSRNVSNFRFFEIFFERNIQSSFTSCIRLDNVKCDQICSWYCQYCQVVIKNLKFELKNLMKTMRLRLYFWQTWNLLCCKTSRSSYLKPNLVLRQSSLKGRNFCTVNFFRVYFVFSIWNLYVYIVFWFLLTYIYLYLFINTYTYVIQCHFVGNIYFNLHFLATSELICIFLYFAFLYFQGGKVIARYHIHKNNSKVIRVWPNI